MRRPYVLYLTCLALLAPTGVWTNRAHGLRPRQSGASSSAVPTLTSVIGASSAAEASVTASSTDESSSPPPTLLPISGPSDSSSADPQPSKSQSSNSTSSVSTSTLSTAVSSKTATPTSSRHSPTATAAPNKDNDLPIHPHITPAFAIAGVILILTGVLYALVGVKNKWIQIFLSTAYLASLSIAVLIDYVMSPPVGSAIQGAYFVGIFMTGLIFGAGALIFKEVTEGLGCLLGGFCLSMWFLTLKPGGLITSAGGKGIFVAIFCAIVWSLSFSHYTRAYGLIASTSFSGATAFVLGIDCFSRAGLKEFWFYVWALNSDLFPLNTNSYPITKGIRVETIIIILGCFIGVMSQIKLWKVVRDRQQRREAEHRDNERRKDVVEEAIGRHIERRNDRDRSQWEKQYGDRLSSKRNTILWTDAHPDKSYTHISIESQPNSQSSSSDSLEMSAFGPRKPAPAFGSKTKRHSTTTVEVIHEELEEHDGRASIERQKALTALEDQEAAEGTEVISEKNLSTNRSPEIIPLPFTVPSSGLRPRSANEPPAAAKDMVSLGEPDKPSKRKSLQSILTQSPRVSTENPSFSESQEALILPELHHSRASSLAATLDEDNDRLQPQSLERSSSNDLRPPSIVISPVGSHENLRKDASGPNELELDIRSRPPSPPALSVNFDFDPEELARPVPEAIDAAERDKKLEAETSANGLRKEVTAEPASDGAAKQPSDGHAQSQVSTGQSFSADGLTKGALQRVPSQLSNVVMSYRTNEWAKHISTAEAPVFDEPESVVGEEDDAPVQLAPPTPASPTSPTTSEGPSLDSFKSLSATTRPPPPHVTALASDGTVAAKTRPLPLRSLTDQSTPTTSTTTPSRSPSTQSSRPSKIKRSSANPMLGKPSLATTPIDENVASEFLPSQKPQRRSTSGMPNRVLSKTSLANVKELSAFRSASALGHSNSNSNSRASIVEPKPAMARSASSLSNYRPSSAMSDQPAMRSETRLGSYESRQPTVRDYGNEAERRETLLTEWRMSQQHGAAASVLPKSHVDTRRAQMLSDKEQTRLMEDQQRAVQQQKQYAIDQVMRRPDMQDLHREAMRKMQAGANKKL